MEKIAPTDWLGEGVLAAEVGSGVGRGSAQWFQTTKTRRNKFTEDSMWFHEFWSNKFSADSLDFRFLSSLHENLSYCSKYKYSLMSFRQNYNFDILAMIWHDIVC